MNTDIHSDMRSLIVIPCLNEARHIEALIEKLGRAIDELDARIVVADGGSTDGRRRLSGDAAKRSPRPPARQPEAAAERGDQSRRRELGDGAEYLIRIDAMATILRLLPNAGRGSDRHRSADSVVVAMRTMGFSAFQKAGGRAEFQARQWRLQASRGGQGTLGRPRPSRADANCSLPARSAAMTRPSATTRMPSSTIGCAKAGLPHLADRQDGR
jgi:hypothetical protein